MQLFDIKLATHAFQRIENLIGFNIFAPLIAGTGFKKSRANGLIGLACVIDVIFQPSPDFPHIG